MENVCTGGREVTPDWVVLDNSVVTLVVEIEQGGNVDKDVTPGFPNENENPPEVLGVVVTTDGIEGLDVVFVDCISRDGVKPLKLGEAKAVETGCDDNMELVGFAGSDVLAESTKLNPPAVVE